MTKKLAKAVDDYLVWMIAAGYASGTIMIHERLLNHFQNFRPVRIGFFRAINHLPR